MKLKKPLYSLRKHHFSKMAVYTVEKIFIPVRCLIEEKKKTKELKVNIKETNNQQKKIEYRTKMRVLKRENTNGEEYLNFQHP